MALVISMACDQGKRAAGVVSLFLTLCSKSIVYAAVCQYGEYTTGSDANPKGYVSTPSLQISLWHGCKMRVVQADLSLDNASHICHNFLDCVKNSDNAIF